MSRRRSGIRTRRAARGGAARAGEAREIARPGRRSPRILIIGFGNPGRRDDGLGPALAARVEALRWSGVTVESDYQLVIEHAALVANHDVVVFADAAVDVPGGAAYYLRSVVPVSGRLGLSHHLSPPAVLQLAADCFHARPRAWALGIRAIDLNSFAEGLTPEAEKNLEVAISRLSDAVRSWRRRCPRNQPPSKRARPVSAAGGLGGSLRRRAKI